MKKTLVILMLIFVMLLILVMIAEPRRTSIVSSFTSDGYVSLSADSMKFLFDTGANMPVIYADTVPEPIFHLRSLAIKDISGNQIKEGATFVLQAYFTLSCSMLLLIN